MGGGQEFFFPPFIIKQNLTNLIINLTQNGRGTSINFYHIYYKIKILLKNNKKCLTQNGRGTRINCCPIYYKIKFKEFSSYLH